MPTRRSPLVRLAVLTMLQAGALCFVATTLAAQVTDTAAGKPAKPPRKRANVISPEEIAALGGTVQTAYGIVQRLRPAMLRARSGSTSQSDGGSVDVSANEVQVFLDSQRMGGVRALEEITLSQILEIRYLNANDATTLFGTGNTAGVIQVIGKR
ncbi:MAG: hypothetical protein V4813_12390 [Gemmatimonadota bacterium]